MQKRRVFSSSSKSLIITINALQMRARGNKRVFARFGVPGRDHRDQSGGGAVGAHDEDLVARVAHPHLRASRVALFLSFFRPFGSAGGHDTGRSELKVHKSAVKIKSHSSFRPCFVRLYLMMATFLSEQEAHRRRPQ